ncbi:MAG: hypothetical protein ABL958_12020 [Bdellovibrionia bacterium]
MKNLILISAIVLTSSLAFAGRDDAGERAIDKAMAQEIQQTETPAQTEESVRELASDFSNDYLDSVKDEQAADRTVAQKDAEEHDRFLRSMKGGNR